MPNNVSFVTALKKQTLNLFDSVSKLLQKVV